MSADTYSTMVLTPAYGRDYKSAEAAIADFVAGKDFVLNTPQGTTYINCDQVHALSVVSIRYDKIRKVAVYRHLNLPNMLGAVDLSVLVNLDKADDRGLPASNGEQHMRGLKRHKLVKKVGVESVHGTPGSALYKLTALGYAVLERIRQTRPERLERARALSEKRVE